MSVLVTGGAGFIGSNLVDELLTQGFEVTVVDDFSEGKMENLARWKGNSKLDVIRGDIRDGRLMERLCDHREWVFHLAGCSRIQPSITDPGIAVSNNMVGTFNVLEAARRGGVKRVVYSASSSAYGSINTPPHEESMPTDCLNPYSLSKKLGEELCALYTSLYGLSTVSLRYFNVYGPRHQEEGAYSTVIAIFRRQKRLRQKLTIVGDGEQRRDFTFVSDVVRANMLAAMNHEVVGTLNIGTGSNYSINEVAALVGGESEFIPARLGEARVTLANAAKAKAELGWEAKVPLQGGLEVLDTYERKFNPGGIILVGG